VPFTNIEHHQTDEYYAALFVVHYAMRASHILRSAFHRSREWSSNGTPHTRRAQCARLAIITPARWYCRHAHHRVTIAAAALKSLCFYRQLLAIIATVARRHLFDNHYAGCQPLFSPPRIVTPTPRAHTERPTQRTEPRRQTLPARAQTRAERRRHWFDYVHTPLMRHAHERPDEDARNFAEVLH